VAESRHAREDQEFIDRGLRIRRGEVEPAGEANRIFLGISPD
jgi:hypothetical protein